MNLKIYHSLLIDKFVSSYFLHYAYVYRVVKFECVFVKIKLYMSCINELF